METKTNIRRVNVETDFAAVFEFGGREALPTWPWVIEFWTERTRNTVSVCFDGKSYSGCFPLPGAKNMIVALFCKHSLDVGMLSYKLAERLPSAIFPCGEQKIVTPDESEIKLWNGKNDDYELPPGISGIVTGLMPGDDGFSPEIEPVVDGEGYKLRITTKTGTFETPALTQQDMSEYINKNDLLYIYCGTPVDLLKQNKKYE